MRHANIPIFVPHLGCPHTCAFCNQRTITGKQNFSFEQVRSDIDTALATLDNTTKKEIAFFGGSFTAIDKELMLSLLSLAEEYVKKGKVSSIRLSTRPDAIDDSILTLLRRFSVKTVELGIQSTDNRVLLESMRGHTKEQSKTASLLIKQYGFSLVGQMMLGLPASTLETELTTARDMLSFGIDAARIYPTVIFPDTTLWEMAKKGAYTPLSVDEAVSRGGEVLCCFDQAKIPVIRIGLCESEGLRETNDLLGAYHPAIGELIQSNFYLRKIQTELARYDLPERADVTVEVAPHALSQAIGQKRRNLLALKTLYPEITIRFRTNEALCKTEVKLYVKEN